MPFRTPSHPARLVVAMIAVLVLPLLIACPEDKTEPAPEVTLQENVHVLSADVAASAQVVNGVYTFPRHSAGVEDAQIGDILVGGEGEGFIVKIADRAQTETLIQLITEPATLEDVIREGTVEQSFAVTASDVTYTAPGVEVSQALALISGSKGTTFPPLTHTFDNMVLFANTFMDITLTQGTVTVTPTVDIAVDYGWNGMQTAEAIGYADVDADLTFVANVRGSADGETKVAEYGVPFGFNVGPIPIVGQIVFELFAGYEASGSATCTVNTHVEGPVEFGATYQRGQGWSLHKDQNLTWDADTDLNAAGHVAGWITPRMRVEFTQLGGLGPMLDCQISLGLDGVYTIQGLALRMTAGLQAHAGMHFGIFSVLIPDLETTLFNPPLEWVLLEVYPGPLPNPALETGWIHRTMRGDMLGHNTYPWVTTWDDPHVIQLRWVDPNVLAPQLLTGDVDGDDELEIVSLGTTGDVFIHAGDGGLDGQFTPNGTTRILGFLGDVDGDGARDIGLGTDNTSALRVDFYDVVGQNLAGFSRNAGFDSSIIPCGFGTHGGLFVSLDSGFALDPRGYSRYGVPSGSEYWHYDMGPRPQISSMWDVDGDGNLEMTGRMDNPFQGATGNGNQGVGTATDDQTGAILVVDENGDEVITDATKPGAKVNILADIDGDGSWDVLSFENHAPGNAWTIGTARIHVYNIATGQYLHTFTGAINTAWQGFAVDNFDMDLYQEVVTINDGTIYLLNHDLSVERSEPMTGRVACAAELDGEERPEVIVIDGNTVRVVDTYNLQPTWSYTFPTTVNDVIVSDINDNGRLDIIVSADKLYVFE